MSDDFLKGIVFLGLGAGAFYLVSTKTDLISSNKNTTVLQYTGASTSTNSNVNSGSSSGGSDAEESITKNFDLSDTPIENSLNNTVSGLGDAWGVLQKLTPTTAISSWLSDNVQKLINQNDLATTIKESSGSDQVTVTYNGRTNPRAL